MTTPGQELITKFEGFSEEAYPDPLHGWKVPTIGYGTTKYSSGQSVKKGDVLTQYKALQELTHFVDNYIRPKLAKVPGWEEMSLPMQGALESFAYNLGADFYGASGFDTLTNRLKNRRWDLVPDAFLLYRNPGTVVEHGLRVRREAEGKVWREGLALLKERKEEPMPSELSGPVLERHKGFVHGGGAEIIEFGGRGVKDGYFAAQIKDGKIVAAKVSRGDEILALKPEDIRSLSWELVKVSSENLGGEINIPVRYFSQRDSVHPDQRDRSCLSSVIAMLIEFLKPGTFPGKNGDDIYLERANRGVDDTTNHQSQVSAAKSFGVNIRFDYTLLWSEIDQELRAGRPVPIGILHRGHISNLNQNASHWILLRGKSVDGSKYLVNDPYGDLDLINGGYPFGMQKSGEGLWYSTKILEIRWRNSSQIRGLIVSGWGIRVVS